MYDARRKVQINVKRNNSSSLFILLSDYIRFRILQNKYMQLHNSFKYKLHLTYGFSIE